MMATVDYEVSDLERYGRHVGLSHDLTLRIAHSSVGEESFWQWIDRCIYSNDRWYRRITSACASGSISRMSSVQSALAEEIHRNDRSRRR